MWAAIAKLRKPFDTKEIFKTVSKEYDHQIKFKRGDEVTITKGVSYKYAIWCYGGVFDMPKRYINESTIKVFSEE